MTKSTIKNIIFIIYLFIINTLLIYLTNSTETAVFLINIIIANLAVIMIYFLNYILKFLEKNKNGFINKNIINKIGYTYMVITSALSLALVCIVPHFVIVLICHSILLLLFFILFAVCYQFAKEEQNLLDCDNQKSIERKALIVDLNGQIGKRNNEIDNKLTKIIDEIKYMPLRSNKYTDDNDKKIIKIVGLMCNELLSDEEYLEAIETIHKLIVERKSLLYITD